MSAELPYLPALRFSSLTCLYDSVMRLLLKDEVFKRRLVAQVKPLPDQRILDVGCGTGTLTLLLKRAAPNAVVIGLDADPTMLRIARTKAESEQVQIEFVEGMSDSLPFPHASFSGIVSSLLLHHLTTDSKRRTLEQAYLLLRPGGMLHIADWGQAQNALMRAAFLGVQLLDGFETTVDNVEGRLLPWMRAAGFADAMETHREMTMLGTLSMYRATRPD